MSNLTGPGINSHGKALPVKELQAIGIQWVRADTVIGKATESLARTVLQHYKPLPVLWMLDNREPDPVKTAKALYRAGVRNIEVVNEPDGDWFKQLSPESAADRFIQIYLALPSTVRLYGPSTARWLPDYEERFIARLRGVLGEDWRDAIAGLSVHLYWSKVEDMPGLVFESQKRWGLPLICTEVSSGNPNWADYPEKRSPADLFVSLKASLGLIPWCFYDGPAVRDQAGRLVPNGLFDWNGKVWVPTETYQRILKASL